MLGALGSHGKHPFETERPCLSGPQAGAFCFCENGRIAAKKEGAARLDSTLSHPYNIGVEQTLRLAREKLIWLE